MRNAPSPAAESRLTQAFNDKALVHVAVDFQYVFYQWSSPQCVAAFRNGNRLAQICRPDTPNIWVTLGPPTGKNRLYIVAPEKREERLTKYFEDAFESSPLASRLRKASASTLLVSGVDAECCVDATIQRALRLGFAVAPVVDAINLEEQTHEGARRQYGSMTLPVTTDEIQNLFTRLRTPGGRG